MSRVDTFRSSVEKRVEEITRARQSAENRREDFGLAVVITAVFSVATASYGPLVLAATAAGSMVGFGVLYTVEQRFVWRCDRAISQIRSLAETIQQKANNTEDDDE